MLLFKYLNEERIDILENQQIRFTQFSNFNDNFEALPVIDSLIPEEQISDFVDGIFNDLSEDELHALLLENLEYFIANNPIYKDLEINKSELFKVLPSLSKQLLVQSLNLKNLSNKEELPFTLRKSLESNTGILSLSEKGDNKLMWAHYSNSSRGFVLILNSKHKFFHQRKSENDIGREIQKVVYLESRPKITLYDQSLSHSELVNSFFENTFLTKHSDWKYEREWRIAAQLDRANRIIKVNNETIHLFSFPADLIHGVIFGYKMADNHKNKIRSILKSNFEYSKVKLYQANIDSYENKLNILPV